MMLVLILTYELIREFDTEFDYYNFYKARDAYHPVKISESSYIIKTSETPSEVRHKLQTHLHKDDNLFVMSVSKPYSSRGRKKIVNWLDANLP